MGKNERTPAPVLSILKLADVDIEFITMTIIDAISSIRLNHC